MCPGGNGIVLFINLPPLFYRHYMNKRSFIIFFFLFVSSTVFAQKLDSLLEVQLAADPQEKMYVHFDKSYYNPGETIWFKAYLFSGINPSEWSKNFYSELLDESGNVLSRKTAPVIFSGASGSFDIDTNFIKPAVYFRAYTVSMLHSDTNFVYTKAIPILNPKALPGKAPAAIPAPTLRILPEGGAIVTGVPSNIAFIATTPNGDPVNINGTVMDNNGVKVTELKTLHNGMGKFALAPADGKMYTATWKDGQGRTYTTALPASLPQGVVLNVTDEGANKRFTIYRSGQVTDAEKQLHIIAYNNQGLAFKADINMAAKTSATGIFPTETIPSGILKITVFDANYKPLCERITFVNNHDYEIDGDVYLTQKNFAKRGLNKVEVMISDTLPANVSLSVTDADLHEPAGMEDNIISRLLLTGELRGKIVNPYAYFFGSSDSSAFYLDLVMLTHGWRRYNWDNVLAGKTTTPIRKEANYLSLEGKVIGLPTRSIEAGLQLNSILLTADSAQNIMLLPVDRKGDVFTDGLIFYDKAKLYFNSNSKSVSMTNGMLQLDNGLYKGPNKAFVDSIIKKAATQVSAAALTRNNSITKLALEERRQSPRSITLGNVTVTAKTKTAIEKMEEKYVSGLFSGSGRSFDLVNDPFAGGYTNIFQYLQGKVAGLQISTSGTSASLNWRGGVPAIYLNEMKADAEMLSGVTVRDIAYVKVFRPGESIAYGGGSGVIAVYTRKGGDVAENPNIKGMNSVQVMGYSAIKEFYAPDYATITEKESVADYRTTLYWNPSIYLDKSRRRIRMQFYNNDITKRFRLVLEGINTDGKLIHLEKEVPNSFEAGN
jgi:hypothetical protein